MIKDIVCTIRDSEIVCTFTIVNIKNVKPRKEFVQFRRSFASLIKSFKRFFVFVQFF